MINIFILQYNPRRDMQETLVRRLICACGKVM